MTMATTDRPVRLTEMGRTEAEQVTQAIKDNFDSLGAMLAQARDRKAYKALGYRSFEAYCQTEFGKSISSAYQLIEDAKVLSQLEERISKEYGEDVILKLPSSHLKPLKEIDNIDDKLKAIEYAQKLAAAESRKPTKKDLEIAVFKISGKRSEDFKNAIAGLGFVKGTPVEVQSPIKKDRGIITRVDKSGKIYVELYYFSAKAMPFNPEELRILSDKERPANPLEGSIANKGDRVLIYAAGFEGQKGTIYTWREGKEALVLVDGKDSPINIAYAEMELLKPEQQNSNWETEVVWNSGKNMYYYLPQENKIHSNLWPTNLAIEPGTHSESPIEFMEDWETNFSARILESLTLGNSTRIKTLVLTQAIELPEKEAKEFANDVITSLRQLFWDEIPGSSALLEENRKLQEQLAEAEAAIQKMVAAVSTSVPENTTSVPENTESPDLPTKIESELSPKISKQITDARTKFFNLIENYEQSKRFSTTKKEIENLDGNIKTLQKRLAYLDKFERLRIGHTICHERQPMILGEIIHLDISQGEMPIIWVKYYKDGKREETPTTEHVDMIFIVETSKNNA
jgi:hypothetical protein